MRTPSQRRREGRDAFDPQEIQTLSAPISMSGTGMTGLTVGWRPRVSTNMRVQTAQVTPTLAEVIENAGLEITRLEQSIKEGTGGYEEMQTLKRVVFGVDDRGLTTEQRIERGW